MMTLPRSSINATRSNLDRALSAKDPSAIATAVDVPLLKTNFVGGPSTGGNDSSYSSGSVHREQLKVDGVDWSNVLNFLLDVHLAISSVSSKLYLRLYVYNNACTGKYKQDVG